MNSADSVEPPGNARSCGPTARSCATNDAGSTGSALGSATDSSVHTTVRPKCTLVHYLNHEYTVISRPCMTVRSKCTTVHI
ncbi:hypothetical protein Hanom_Chr01g00052691 [Helianthus anomalus]